MRSKTVPILKWEKRYELGVKFIDQDHKRLVDLLNEIHENIINCASKEALGAVIVELLDYTTYHFAAEEKSMVYYGYGNLPAHQEEHLKFCRMVATFLEDSREGKEDPSLDILSFLGNWLFDHILQTDSEYCRFLAQGEKQL
jgi:hemerythrin-like metal-binding protein